MFTFVSCLTKIYTYITVIIVVAGANSASGLLIPSTRLNLRPLYSSNDKQQTQFLIKSSDILFVFPIKVFDLKELSLLNNLLDSEPFRLVISSGFLKYLFLYIVFSKVD